MKPLHWEEKHIFGVLDIVRLKREYNCFFCVLCFVFYFCFFVFVVVVVVGFGFTARIHEQYPLDGVGRGGTGRDKKKII